MNLSNKRIKQIKRGYPKKSVKQLAEETGLSENRIKKVLGIKPADSAFTIENCIGYLVCFLVVVSPFVFFGSLSDFADLPQRFFIQAVSIVLILLFIFLTFINSKISIPKIPIVFLTAGFILWSLLSVCWAHNSYEAFYSSIHWFGCAVIFFLLCTVLNSEKWLEKILASIFISMTGVVLLGIGQQFFGIEWVPALRPPSACFANKNMAAQYLAIVLPVALAIGFYKKRVYFYASVVIVFPLSLIALYYMEARASWLAIACALVWTSLLFIEKRFNKKYIIKMLTIILILIGIMSSFAILSGKAESLIKKAGPSAKYRTVVWRNSVEMIKEKPLLGFGAGSFRIFYPGYLYKAELDRAFGKTKQIRRTHNDFIQAGVETGIIGMILFVMLPFSGLYMAWRIVHSDKLAHISVLVYGLSAGLVSFMVTAFFSFPFQRSIPPLMLFIFLGALAILYNSLPDKKRFCFNLPKPFGKVLLMAVFIFGIIFISFSWKGLIADKHFKIATAMEKSRKNDLALTYAHKSHKYNKYRMDVLTTLGRAYIATEKPEQGIEALKQVIEKWPYNINAHLLLGVAYANSDKKEEALKSMKKALDIKPNFMEARKLVVMLKSRKKVRINLK